MNSYHLYAMPTKPETIDGMGPQRFSRVTPEYTLVYTDGEPPKQSVELSEDDAVRLTKADESWVRNCNITLIKEEIERQKPEMIRKISESIEKLETILQELAEESAQEAAEAENE